MVQRVALPAESRVHAAATVQSSDGRSCRRLPGAAVGAGLHLVPAAEAEGALRSHRADPHRNLQQLRRLAVARDRQLAGQAQAAYVRQLAQCGIVSAPGIAGRESPRGVGALRSRLSRAMTYALSMAAGSSASAATAANRGSTSMARAAAASLAAAVCGFVLAVVLAATGGAASAALDCDGAWSRPAAPVVRSVSGTCCMPASSRGERKEAVYRLCGDQREEGSCSSASSAGSTCAAMAPGMAFCFGVALHDVAQQLGGDHQGRAPSPLTPVVRGAASSRRMRSRLARCSSSMVQRPVHCNPSFRWGHRDPVAGGGAGHEGTLAVAVEDVPTLGKAVPGGDGRGCTQCSTRYVPGRNAPRPANGDGLYAHSRGCGNAVLRAVVGTKNGTARAVPSEPRGRALTARRPSASSADAPSAWWWPAWQRTTALPW